MAVILKKPFVFVRHAQTDWNYRNLCQGQKDIPLSQEGRQQAEAFAKQTQKKQIKGIVSSPLSRALDTAREIHRMHPVAEFHIIPELVERGWGELEGISSKEMYEIEEMEENDPLFSPGRGVEPREAFRQRVIQGIAKAQNSQTLPWIISHGRVFLELCRELSIPFVRQISSCQLIEVIPETNQWRIHVFERSLY